MENLEKNAFKFRNPFKRKTIVDKAQNNVGKGIDKIKEVANNSVDKTQSFYNKHKNAIKGSAIGAAGVGTGVIGANAYNKSKQKKEAGYYTIGKELLEKDAIAMPKFVSSAGNKLKDVFNKTKDFASKHTQKPRDFVSGHTKGIREKITEKNPYKGMWRSSKSGKNKIYNAISKGFGDDIAKTTLRNARIGTGVLTGGLAGTGAIGYALGKRNSKKEASYYNIGKELLNKEASPKLNLKELLQFKGMQAKEYLNKNNFINSFSSTGRSKAGVNGGNRLYNNLVGKKGYMTGDAQKVINKRRMMAGGAAGVGLTGIGAGTYALKNKKND